MEGFCGRDSNIAHNTWIRFQDIDILETADLIEAFKQTDHMAPKWYWVLP